MVWFQVDDGFTQSDKVLSIPKRRRAVAVGVWTMAGNWSAAHLTDGFVPRHVLDSIPSAAQGALDLISANLWLTREDGIEFKNWAKYQQTREKVMTKRAQVAARQRAFVLRQQAKALGIPYVPETEDLTRDSPVSNAITNAPLSKPNQAELKQEAYVRSASDDFEPPALQDEPRSKPVTIGAARLSKVYCDRVRLSDRGKISMIITNATAAGYTDEQISGALIRLADDKRPCTTDTLRIEIEGRAPANPHGLTFEANGVVRAPSGRPIAGKGWEGD